MTDQIDKPSQPKSYLLVSLLAVLVLVCAWLTYFLVNFDLNDYREDLEAKLVSHLSLPVKIGNLNYEFHGDNLALHVDGLHIGDHNSPLEVVSPELTIDLDWLGLLQRSFKISAVTLSNPQVKIRQAPADDVPEEQATNKPTPLLVDLALLYETHVNQVVIENGSLHLETFAPSNTQIIVVQNINGSFSNIRLAEMAEITLDGELLLPGQQQACQWLVQGEAGLEIDKDKGLKPLFNLDGHFADFDFDALNNVIDRFVPELSVQGRADVDLHLKGDYPQDIDFQIGISAERVAVLPKQLYSSPISFRHLVASGRHLVEGQNTRLTDLSLQIDQSRLSAQLEWQNRNLPLNLSAKITNSYATVAQIKQWLPDLGAKWVQHTDNLLDQGSLHLESGLLLYESGTGKGTGFRVETLQGEFLDLAWAIPNRTNLSIKNIPFSLNGGQWVIQESPAEIGSLSFVTKGNGELGPNHFQITSLDFKGNINPSELLHEWYFPKTALVTDGEVAFTGHMEGPKDKVALDFQVNLANLSLQHPAGLKLAPGVDDKLALHATITPAGVNLDHGSVKWSAARGHVNGSYQFGAPDSLAIDAQLSIKDLTRIAESLPILEKLALHGQADLLIIQRGDPELVPPEMTLTLRDAGMRATRFIADLKYINGRIDLEPTGFQAKDLSVHLGESLLTVDAELVDFTAPHLRLKVKGPAVRAKDVVFYSDSAILRDIEGALEIDKTGLTFKTVNVRLDGGTDASVSGTIAFAPPYPVNLDIQSEYSLLGEVIGLWKDSPKTDKADQANETGKPRQKTPVTIKANVKNGDLYGMKFRNASGVIKPSREQLVIHPLDFSVGEGYCNAQVITYFRPNEPGLLQISGHAEDVDALEVYRELLNQKSIVKGKLRGDFYLTGEIGSNYLPSSHGRFNLQLKDGVLHQFPIISKVFSLLNVSQIFALQLPDMDLEGMPFNNLTGNLRLTEGVLSSDNLTIASEAMNQSYSGQLDLVNKEIDLLISVHPLGTVDKIVSRIPIAGWLLTGEDRALLTAHFKITGKTDSVSVQPLPLDTLAEPTIGLLRRTLKLPFKLIEDPQILWGGETNSETAE